MGSLTELRDRSKTVLLVSNTGWYLYNFRRPLARALRARGLNPVFVSPKDQYVERLEAEGYRWIEFEIQRGSLNPLAALASVFRLCAIYQRERPCLVHHFTVKCIIFGMIASRYAQVSAAINAVTGLGHVFVSKHWRMKLLRPIARFLYKWALSDQSARVVFQNQDDLAAFVDLGLVSPELAVLIRSSGVDTARFAPEKHGAEPSKDRQKLIVLFASRLLLEKGLLDFVDAAKRVRDHGYDAVFWIAGSPDLGNPSSIKEEMLMAWKEQGIVTLLGHVEEVDELIKKSDLVVLPSYREGLPRILLEACALEKPVIATDVPGCREIVIHGENGYLTPLKDPLALAGAIETLLSDSELRDRMGKAGRRLVLKEFSEAQVVNKTLDIYETLGVLEALRDERQVAL